MSFLEAAPPWARASALASGPLARFADRFGMWMMLRRFYGGVYPLEPVQLTQVSWEPYLELLLDRDRERLFPAARPPQQVATQRVAALLDDPERRPIWMPRDLRAGSADVSLVRSDFAFPSAHRPLTPAFAEQLDETPENGTVHGRIYAPEGVAPRRAVIIVHGFGSSCLDSVARFTPAERMAAREAAVVLVSLPYHAQRKPAAARFSGEYFMSGDVVRTFEAVLQAVSDLRTLIAWLRDDHGIDKVGLIGGSLGGYLATLTAAVEPQLDMLYAIAPPIRVTENIDSVPLGRHIRAGLHRQRVAPDVLHQLQDLVDPSCHAPALPIERMRFIAGRNDLFVPRIHMERLQQSWQGLQVHWHDWGHITALLAWPPKRLFDEVEGFLDTLGF